LPGKQVDYEVDYDEEVKHLTKQINDHAVKKQDFLNVMFDKGAFPIKSNFSIITENAFILDINLRNPNFYVHQLNPQ
jgi:hypothetical protein